jgi:hypothetical protein
MPGEPVSMKTVLVKAKDVASVVLNLDPTVESVVSPPFSFDPLSSFELAWIYINDRELDLVLYLGHRFSVALEALCKLESPVQWPLPSLSGELSGVTRFVSTTTSLLGRWRNDPVPGMVLEGSGAQWLERHPEILRKIQAAQSARSRHCTLGERTWNLEELLAGSRSRRDKKLEVAWVDKLSGQRTWPQAAETMAYAVFGDFLADETGRIGFCGRCERPFERGKRKLFCSSKCAHTQSSTTSRHGATARDRRRGLRKAAKSLKDWLQKPHRSGSDWRKTTEIAFGLHSSDGRHSRLMGAYIRASQTSPESPEREKLLRSLLSSSTETPQERKKVQLQLEGFLQDIARAENRSKAGLA